MAKTNHKFPDHANRNYYERDTEFEVLLNSLYHIIVANYRFGRETPCFLSLPPVYSIAIEFPSFFLELLHKPI